ncbi:MAG: hypothetical protein KatS3mg068_0589 [Candidatus Sericytochromatia bacterium]|nr:MAG: hypothetical protein KatS3mg068_0589 [Candidatus Sericytochromatia bacterium]
MIKNNIKNLSVDYSNSLEEIYLNINKAINQIQNNNTNIECISGCNRCCKFYGSPQIYKMEWENIKKYIKNNFTEDDIKILKLKLKELKKYFRDLLVKNENVYLDDYQLVKEVIDFIECPLLFNGKCSIYEVRPLICRLFGYTYTNKKTKKTNILTCQEQVYKLSSLKDELELINIEQINQNIFEILSEDDVDFNTIYYYLTNMLEND